MAELKTKLTGKSVDDFLNSVENEKKRKNSFILLDLFRQATQKEPQMWGDSIVGFGKYHYTYESGREGDWFLAGFSPRKQNLVLYFMFGYERFPDLLQKLGKYKTGKACMYINTIEDIDLNVLKELVTRSISQNPT